VSGLVLTGETAVGSDPYGAVERVARLLAGFEEKVYALAGSDEPVVARGG